MKFVIDAHLPPALARLLREADCDAFAVREIGLREASDAEIWRYAVQQQAGAPGPLRQHLPGHTIATAFEMGWAEFGNGDLLPEADFSVYDLRDCDSGRAKGSRLYKKQRKLSIRPND